MVRRVLVQPATGCARWPFAWQRLIFYERPELFARTDRGLQLVASAVRHRQAGAFART